MESQYYDGTKLLSMKDINGNTPEIYICSTNRSGGKTTYFNRWCTKRFIEHNEKFMLIYRFNYELTDIANKFFKEIHTLFYPDHTMTSKSMAKGMYHELFLDDISCGYAVALNNADQLKKVSHLFSDTCRMLFDEFQSEINHYCPDEVKKFQSIHTSVARGGGKQVRYVPVYMLGNYVSLLNPYYVALGISTRLRNDTNFLKGDGFVVEQGFIETASKLQKESAFNRAFAESDYVQYASERVYLNDNNSFISKPEGKSKYICTLKYENRNYGIREYSDEGILYCDNTADLTYPMKITITTSDHDINYLMLRRNDSFLDNMRWYFEHGCFRFKDVSCKDVVLRALAYTL